MSSVETTETTSTSKASVIPFVTKEKQTLILCLLLAVATLAVYNPVARNGFINFDDNQYITQNAHVQAGLSWDTIRWSFTTFEAANWHPLTWLSVALDCQIFKLNPAGHHYVAVLLHAINSILLFLLLQRATGFTWRSLTVAALFALHPVNVESVAWAAERKNLLSMFFFLLALRAYGEYARAPKIQRYCWVFVLYALGLMSKPQIVTFPLLLLLWDYWPLNRFDFVGAASDAVSTQGSQRPWKWLVVEKTPLLLLSAVSALITMKAQQAGKAVRTTIEFSVRSRLENAVVSYARYIGNALWPARLSPMYPHLETLLPVWQVVGAVLIVLTITVFVFAYSRRRYLIVGWLWFLGSMVPMVGLVQVGEQAMADRYAYLPFIGLFLMIVWGMADAAQYLRIPGRWLAIPATVVLLILCVITHRQIAYWHDSETLWNYSIRVTNDNFMAQDNLAQELAKQGRTQEAIVHFRLAENLHAYEPSQLLVLGVYEFNHGYPQDAIGQYERVLRQSSDPALQSSALDDLGLTYLELKNYGQAQKAYHDALSLNPNKPETLMGIGLVAQKTGNLSEAISRYSQVVSIHPTDIAYLLLQRALQQSGRTAEAESAYQQAARLSPDLNEANRTVDQLLAP